ncbi:MAG: PKD domain-containing protein, partial [Thermodesulfovibrionales bacterium]|nr:PKD domain-containing protein [Thermodesulfovibrionales bacterium]
MALIIAGCGDTSNSAPVANAGLDQNVVTGSVVTLDGSGSSDANGDTLTYKWTITSKPSGSAAVLSSSTVAKPTFTADKDGSYV